MKKNKIIWIVAVIVILALAVGVIVYNNNITANNAANTKNSILGTVNIQKSSYNPGTMTIKNGDTVTWKNDDSVAHSVVADDDSFNSGEIIAGSKYKRTFVKTGTYNYHCVIHPNIKGVVVVK